MDNENKVLNENELNEVSGGGTTNKFTKYTVVKGDNLHKIAKKFGCSVDDIMRLNSNIKDRNLIRVGWILTVPDNR